MARIRTFIAVEMSPSVKGRAGDLIDRLRVAPAEVNWVRPEQMHLTRPLGHASHDFRILHLGPAVPVVLPQRNRLVQLHLEMPADGQIEVLAADVDVFDEQQLFSLHHQSRGPRVAHMHHQGPRLAVFIPAVLGRVAAG
jgi:hypothetical protein